MILRYFLASLSFAVVCLAAEARKPVPFSELPIAVQKAIAKLGGNAASAVTRVDDDGDVSFETEITQGGRERDISVGEDGTLLSIELNFAETPAAVQKAITAQVSTGALVGVDKIIDDGQTSYDVVMTTKAGEERAFIVEENGKVSNAEIGLSEAPPAVQKTITAQVGAGKLGAVTRVFDETTTYDVEASAADGKAREFSVANDGKLLSERVALEGTPAEVQKTIREKIGAGKILRIDKSFEKRSKTLPYEIEGVKDGKPFNFSVGAAGKFLGMDE